MILYMLLGLLVVVESHLVLEWVLFPMRPKTQIRRISKLGQVEVDFWAKWIEQVTTGIKKYFPNNWLWRSLESKSAKQHFESANGHHDPIYYVIKKCSYALITLTVGGVLSLLTSDVRSVSYFFAGGTVLLTMMAYRLPDYEYVRMKKKRDEQIILELPRFIRTIRYSPEGKPLIAIVRDYLKIAKSGLKMDLVNLLGDLELNVTEDKALQCFSERMGSPEIRELVAALRVTLNASRKDNLLTLMFIEDKLTEKARRLVQRELDRRPEILESLNDILLYALGLIFLVPMAITMLTGLSAFMG